MIVSNPVDLVHEGLFYHDAAGLLAGTMPFIEEGLANGEPVLVATPGPRLELIRSAVGTRGDEVRYTDTTRAGRNPGRIIPRVLQAFVDRHPGRRVRIVLVHSTAAGTTIRLHMRRDTDAPVA